MEHAAVVERIELEVDKQMEANHKAELERSKSELLQQMEVALPYPTLPYPPFPTI